MGQCKAWLNGAAVGTVYWNTATGHATVHCALPEGWIYRAVLLLEEREIANFGVLLPETNGFSANLQLRSIDLPNDARLQCEVLRSKPGEAGVNDGSFTLSQFSCWDEAAFELEPALVMQIKGKNNAFYRIYNQKRYLLLKLNLTEYDPFVTMYAIGRPIEIESQWYLYLQIHDNGKPIPWATDEK